MNLKKIVRIVNCFMKTLQAGVNTGIAMSKVSGSLRLVNTLFRIFRSSKADISQSFKEMKERTSYMGYLKHVCLNITCKSIFFERPTSPASCPKRPLKPVIHIIFSDLHLKSFHSKHTVIFYNKDFEILLCFHIYIIDLTTLIKCYFRGNVWLPLRPLTPQDHPALCNDKHTGCHCSMTTILI